MALFGQGACATFDGVEPADTGTDVHTDTLGIRFGNLKSGIAHCLNAGRHAKVDEAVHATRLFLGHVLCRIETLHFSGNGCRETSGIELGNLTNAAFAGQDALPVLGEIETDGETTPIPVMTTRRLLKQIPSLIL